MRLPWTIQHWLKYQPHLTPASIQDLRQQLVAELKGSVNFQDTIDLQMKHLGKTLRLRPSSNDIYTFDEVFIEEVYRNVIKDPERIVTVLDIGANVGMSTLYFLHHCPKCRVFAVEPDRNNFKILEANIKQDGLESRVTAVQAAAWNCEAPVRFMPPMEPGHVNQGAVGSSISSSGYDVPGLPIQSIIAKSGFNEIDVLKVDIEGGERVIFEDETSWLNQVECIAIEFHGDSRSESGFDRVMKQYSFECADYGHTVIARRKH